MVSPVVRGTAATEQRSASSGRSIPVSEGVDTSVISSTTCTSPVSMASMARLCSPGEICSGVAVSIPAAALSVILVALPRLPAHTAWYRSDSVRCVHTADSISSRVCVSCSAFAISLPSTLSRCVCSSSSRCRSSSACRSLCAVMSRATKMTVSRSYVRLSSGATRARTAACHREAAVCTPQIGTTRSAGLHERSPVANQRCRGEETRVASDRQACPYRQPSPSSRDRSDSREIALPHQ